MINLLLFDMFYLRGEEQFLDGVSTVARALLLISSGEIEGLSLKLAIEASGVGVGGRTGKEGDAKRNTSLRHINLYQDSIDKPLWSQSIPRPYHWSYSL